MSAVLAKITDFGVSYGGPSPALSGVTLDLIMGERLAIIGESGSGKSTLALALAGLLADTARQSGSIVWPGLDGEKPVPGRDIGFVFQDPGSSLNPVLSVGEQIAEVAQRHLGLSWNAAYASARELLSKVAIPEPERAIKAYPHQFSGGQRQRIAIAQAIAGNPKLLIADEATSALDMVVQAEIVTLLDDLVREGGMTLLFITHDIALAAGLADRIAVFRQAQLVEIGDAEALVRAPRDAYTSALLASHIGLDATPLIAERLP